MITLTGRRLIAECDVFPDDVDPLTYYLLPKAPRIALNDDGMPMFHLVWYRRPVDRLTEEERRTRLGGGILTVSTDLTPTQDEEARIRTELAADPALKQRVGGQLAADPGALAAALKVAAVPVKDGTVRIAVMAESPDAGAPAGEMVANLVGVGRVSASGVGRSSFMAKLTQDGAALLWEMVDKKLQPIRVEYDILFDHRLDGVTMYVHCDVKKTFDATHEVWQDLKDDASWSERHSGNDSSYTFSRDEGNTGGNALRKIATDAQTIDVKVIPEAGPDVVTPELVAQLTQQGTDMVTDFLASSFLEVDTEFEAQQEPTLETQLAEHQGKAYGHHGIHFYKLKSADTDVQGELNYTLKTKAVVQGHLTPNDNLADVTGGRDVEEFRTRVEIDPDFYKFLAVEVLCTADFDNEPVDLVRGTLRYRQGSIDTAQDVVFSKADAGPKSFATYLAGPSAREYSYDLEVFYRGSSQTFTRTGRSSSDVLVLDTDTLGILRVDLQVGVVDFTRIASVLVELSQGSGAARKHAEFTLTSAVQNASWVEVTPAGSTEPYTYRCTFIDVQGQRIEQPEQTSTARRLVIEQPINQSLEVAVIPAGSFGPDGLIARVVVALRYVDANNGSYTVDDLITLGSDADTKVWTVPLIDPTHRTYDYRVTVFYSDGVTREDTWQTTDRTILAAGDPFGMRVQILPYRLKVSGLYEFATIHLSFSDAPSRITAEEDLTITDFTQPLYWRFRLGSPERHTFTYQLSLFTKDGRQIDLPEAEASREVLTLAPPEVA